MYEYVIPQEFNQSDRIGNYTIPQAMILGFGVLLIALILASGFISFWIGIPLSFVILGVTFYVMKKTINGIPLYEFFLIYAIYRSSPKLIIYKLDNTKEGVSLEEEEEKIASSIFVEDEKEEKEEINKRRKDKKRKQTKKAVQQKNTRKTVKKRK